MQLRYQLLWRRSRPWFSVCGGDRLNTTFDFPVSRDPQLRFVGIAAVVLALCFGSSALARSPATDAAGGMSLCVHSCFSPFLTADTAKRAFNMAHPRHDFFDLDPVSDVAPSPATGDVTPGADRRCKVAFDGDYCARASEAAMSALAQEGILTKADVTETDARAATDGTALPAARQLNPTRIAVEHVGTRPGPDGIGTFVTVERLRPQQ